MVGGADGSRSGGSGRGGRRRGLQDIHGEHRATLYGQRQGYDEMVQTVKDMVDGAGAKINLLVLRSDDLPGALKSWTPRQYELEVEALGGKTVLDLRKPGRVSAHRPQAHQHAVSLVEAKQIGYRLAGI